MQLIHILVRVEGYWVYAAYRRGWREVLAEVRFNRNLHRGSIAFELEDGETRLARARAERAHM